MSANRHSPEAARPPGDDEIAELQTLLDRIPPPLQPLDISALDGFLCGVLLQPNDIGEAAVMRRVCDVEGRALPAGHDDAGLRAAVRQRRAHLARALQSRQWFDPWVFELDGDATPAEAMLPWVAGFALAMEQFPELLRMGDSRLLEPLALLYQHFDPADLDDADALRQLIDTLEPPPDLAEAVQDLVRGLMLIADEVQSQAGSPRAGRRRGR